MVNTPKWMNKELFEDAFRTYYKNKSVQILDYSCKPAVAMGENFTSDVFRVSVTYKSGKNDNKETVSLILKHAPDGGILGDLAKTMRLFEKEAEMFGKTLPKMYEVAGQYGIFSSICFEALNDPLPLLILQDLSPLGFVNAKNRQEGFDLDHCLIVLKKMAAFHATSVVMCENDPSVISDQYNEGIYLQKDMVAEWLTIGFESLTDALGRWPGCERYHAKLKRLGARALTKCYASWKQRLGGFNVLNHGDLWANNIMFTYGSDGKATDCRFVDFQLVIHSTPAIDLHYFLATSPRDDVRTEYLDFFLDYYYANLLATLTDLKYTLERIPTREDFRADFKARAFYGLAGAATVTPLVKSDGRKDATFEDLFNDESDDGFRFHCYNNESYKSAITQLMPFYDNLGVLD